MLTISAMMVYGAITVSVHATHCPAAFFHSGYLQDVTDCALCVLVRSKASNAVDVLLCLTTTSERHQRGCDVAAAQIFYDKAANVSEW